MYRAKHARSKQSAGFASWTVAQVVASLLASHAIASSSEETPLPPLHVTSSSHASDAAAKRPRPHVVRTHEPSEPEEAKQHRQACQKGDPAACHAAALDAYYSPRSPANDRAAFTLFKKGCDGGYAASCNGLGLLFAEGRGTAKDPVRAAQLYRDACAADSSTACQHLAMALHDGIGVPKDEAASERARSRASCMSAAIGKRSVADCPRLLAESSTGAGRSP